MIAAWNSDWQWWATRPATGTAIARWAERHACLSGLACADDVLNACGGDRSVPEDLADERLAAIVGEACHGDQDATRLALQRVLPGLVTRAARRARAHQVRLDRVLEDLISAAWLGVSEFPLHRRPAKIAVNVIRDAEHRVFGYVPMIRQATVPMDPHHLPHQPLPGAVVGPAGFGDPQEATDAVPVILREAIRHGLPAQDAWLLAQMYVLDQSTTQISAAEGRTARSVRYHHQRAVQRLSAVLASPTRYTAPPDPHETTRVRPVTGRRTAAAIGGVR